MHPPPLRFASILFLAIFLIQPLSGAEECSLTVGCEDMGVGNTGTSAGDWTVCLYLFYGQGCPHCARIEPLVDEMAVKYPRVEVRKFEVYFNSTNQEKFRDFLSRYNVTVDGVPILFIGDRVLVGESSIRQNLEPSIVYFLEHEPVCPETYNKIGGDENGLSPSERPELTIPVIIVAAAVDSINPCAFAVLIVLLSYLIALGDRRRMGLVGIVYILTVFTVYFISGLGLLIFVQGLGLTKIVYFIAALIAIGAGAINLYEVLIAKKRFSLSIPESKKVVLKGYISKASVPAAILLGGLVSLFELPCTGGIYLAILGLLASKLTFVEGLPYLLLYNLVFVLPLFVIFGVVYYGISPAMLENFSGGSRYFVRAIMGAVMIIIGAVMLFGFV